VSLNLAHPVHRCYSIEITDNDTQKLCQYKTPKGLHDPGIWSSQKNTQ